MSQIFSITEVPACSTSTAHLQPDPGVMAPSFRSWTALNEAERLGCIKENRLQIRYNDMAAWEADGCLADQWNETIFDCVLSIMNNAALNRRSGFRRSSDRLSPKLRMLSHSGRREDAVPFLILTGEGASSDTMLRILKENRTMKRYGFRFAADKRKIDLTGGELEEGPKDDSSKPSSIVQPVTKQRVQRPQASSRTVDEDHPERDLRYEHPRTLEHRAGIVHYEDRVTSSDQDDTQALSSPRSPYSILSSPPIHHPFYILSPGRPSRFTAESHRSRASELDFQPNPSLVTLPRISNTVNRTVPPPPPSPNATSACGVSIRVLVSGDEFSNTNTGRLATIGGVFRLRVRSGGPSRYFALTVAHIFEDPSTATYASSESSETPTPRGSSGEDESSSLSNHGDDLNSATPSHVRLPREYSVFNANTLERIGCAFTQEQINEFSIERLYNPSLDWALVELTDRKLKLPNTYHFDSNIFSPKIVAERTKPPSGDVLILSNTERPLRCRSIGTRSAINPEWADGFVEAWTIDCKSEFGSCGSWVVNPVTSRVLGILVAHTEDEPLTYMLPAHKIFADIEGRWKVNLDKINNAAVDLEKSRNISISSYRPINPRAKLALPNDVLAFIHIPEGHFIKMENFLLTNPRFLESIQPSIFADAAVEAKINGDVALMRRCVQRFVIAIKGKESVRYLKSLMDRDQDITMRFYMDFAQYLQAVEKEARKIQGTLTHSDADRPESMTLGTRYPVSRGPFDQSIVREDELQQDSSDYVIPDDRATQSRFITDLPPQQGSLPAIEDHATTRDTYPPSSHLPKSLPPLLSPLSTLPHLNLWSTDVDFTRRLKQRSSSSSDESHGGSSALSAPSTRRTSISQAANSAASFGAIPLGAQNAAIKQGNTIDINRLKPGYGLKNGYLFFERGRVFSVMFPEPMGINPMDTRKEPNVNPNVVEGPKGEKIYCRIKSFVVIKRRHGYSVCVPINSYLFRGVQRKHEQGSHSIIYDSRLKKAPVPFEGETGMTKIPIAVDVNRGQKLDPASRINFGRVTSIEWNVSVLDIGRVAQSSMPVFESYWKEELL